MKNRVHKFSYNVPQCYLELARSALTSLHSTKKREDILKNYPNEMANALFALVSTSVIYSYMTIEAFVNAQLYNIWTKRKNSNSYQGKKFNSEFSNIQEFESLKKDKKIRELNERIKTLCRLLEYKQIHNEDPKLWQEFNELIDKARHYLIHPFPDPQKFNETMKTILEQNKAGLYVEVAEKIINYLYSQAKRDAPDWLKENKLLKNRGYILLTDNQ
jgi:hypothetical protein